MSHHVESVKTPWQRLNSRLNVCGSEGSSPGGWCGGRASIHKIRLSTNLLRSMFVNPGSHHYISCVVLNMVSLKRDFHDLQHFTWIFITSLIRRENMFIGLMDLFSSNLWLCFCLFNVTSALQLVTDSAPLHHLTFVSRIWYKPLVDKVNI